MNAELAFAKIQNIGHGLLDLIFPRLCTACEESVPIEDHVMCLDCLCSIGFTSQHLYESNFFAEHFWGRVRLHRGSAMMILDEEGKVLDMIHRIKYRGAKDLAERLGRWYGESLRRSGYYDDLTAVIPVPLHPKKLRQRGYNQAVCIAEGIADSLNVPLWEDALIRVRHTQSQTKMNRMQRMQNLVDAIRCRPDILDSGDHVLLVDDVLTTGATLESCARAIDRVAQPKMSMCTLAMGNPS